ncbi:MAG TPA: YafY family protein [Thermomicrobiales bacterium]|nr:YafY family protein [Thermomicrobiales bacterium]
MYQPTSRVLTVLELLQARPGISGAELAERLEVDRRTVRRYITTLQDLGVPVEGTRGRHGGYRLRPGYKLPPLMLTDDEALAVNLGLLLSRRLGLTIDETSAESASSKLSRVLPIPLREQARAIREVVSVAYPESETQVESRKLGGLTTAAGRRKRVRLDYHPWRGEPASREVDPYGLVYLIGRWYLVGYCHLRRDLRMFRLDRIEHYRVLEIDFEPPEGFDCMAFAERSIASMPGTWDVEVWLDLPPFAARDQIPPTRGLVSEGDDGGTLFRCTTYNLDEICRFLVNLDCDFRIITPDALRERMQRLADRLARLAGDAVAG